jgi:hypothetical protein
LNKSGVAGGNVCNSNIELIRGVSLHLLSNITEIETIATGTGVRIRRHLNRKYGKGRWRKLKGIATLQLADGTVARAEIHWFEAHGIGRKDFKIKRILG